MGKPERYETQTFSSLMTAKEAKNQVNRTLFSQMGKINGSVLDKREINVGNR